MLISRSLVSGALGRCASRLESPTLRGRFVPRTVPSTPRLLRRGGPAARISLPDVPIMSSVSKHPPAGTLELLAELHRPPSKYQFWASGIFIIFSLFSLFSRFSAAPSR